MAGLRGVMAARLIIDPFYTSNALRVMSAVIVVLLGCLMDEQFKLVAGRGIDCSRHS